MAMLSPEVHMIYDTIDTWLRIADKLLVLCSPRHNFYVIEQAPLGPCHKRAHGARNVTDCGNAGQRLC